jgi:Ecdysteroid kinase-like family
MNSETLPAAVSANRLSDVLRRCGTLPDDSISDVTVDSLRKTIVSQITRLRLTYAGEASGAPSTLIFKTSLPERIENPNWNAGRHEVAFYNDVAAMMGAGLVPRCFEAKWEADTRAWHLLLEDLTDSHFVATAWPLPPNAEQCEKVVRARARFHAQWWNHPRLGTTVGTWPPADDSQLTAFDTAVTRFFDRVGDLLPSHRRDLYRQLIDRGPELNKRCHSHRDLTIGVAVRFIVPAAQNLDLRGISNSTWIASGLSSGAVGTRIALLSIEPWPPRPLEAHGGERAASDHDAAATPTPTMNSRRRIGHPSCRSVATNVLTV